MVALMAVLSTGQRQDTILNTSVLCVGSRKTHNIRSPKLRWTWLVAVATTGMVGHDDVEKGQIP